MRRWIVGFVGATLPMAAASFAFPQYHLVFWGLFGWSASAAVVVGVAMNRPGRRLPWLLVATALAVFVTGAMVYDVMTEVLHYRDPFPSVADAFFVATYPLFACGLLGLVRARSPARRLGPLLDALIVTTSAGVFVAEPSIRTANMPLLDKVVSIAYPLGDIAVLCVGNAGVDGGPSKLVGAPPVRRRSRSAGRRRLLWRQSAQRKLAGWWPG